MIAVSTNGQSPLLASKIERLAKLWPRYQDLLDLLGNSAALAKERFLRKKKEEIFDKLLELMNYYK